MHSFFYEAVEENPIIAAVKNMDDLEICCSLENIQVIFILFGDVCSIREIVVEFIQRNTEADGIISTKSALIKKGRELDYLLFSDISFWIQWHMRISGSNNIQ